jgi:hypothetical protein
MADTASRRCTFTTAGGKPCRAWAVRGTDPPTCAAHSGRTHGGAPEGNQNARTHGFYSNVLQEHELADLVAYSEDLDLDDEIALARIILRRLVALLTPTHHTDLPDIARIAGLALQATRTIARLLRDKRALSGEAADGIAGAIAQALDELSTEWGVEL